MDIYAALDALASRNDLTQADSRALFGAAMRGELTPSQLGGVLMALRVKGETADELAGAAEAMRALSLKVELDLPNLVDTCGTGGSGAKLFNVSTASAFVVAACGANVAKHGNRAMTSKSGSADLLEAAGVRLDLAPQDIATCVERAGVGFMFAQAHHSAMRHAAPTRRELRVRTLMNVLGPLTNPAGAQHQLIGVFSPDWQQRVIEVLRTLGSTRALCVHGDGLDELTLAGPSRVIELSDGEIREYTISPEDVGLRAQPLDGLVSDSPESSLILVRQSLRDVDSPAAAIVAYNAGAALYAARRADSIADGVSSARDAISDGSAAARLELLASVSQELGG
ncbi:MAG: anthranilate phosphoribosyltransferase [Pseudomonadota bacterium]